MPSLNENLSTVRLLLDRPDDHHPGQDLLFILLNQQVQHHLNQLQNSSSHWSVSFAPLVTSAGNPEYLITAPNFGKPFLVETIDNTDPSFVQREVPFVLLQNRFQFYTGVQQTQITEAHTALLASFYRGGEGGWYVRITPTPGGSKEYRIWYETASSPVPSLGAEIGLSPFQHLICVQTAIAAIPHCHWGQIRPDAMGEMGAAWERKTQALAAARSSEEVKFQKEFSTYIGTLMQSGIESRTPFAEEADSHWWSNVVHW